MALWVIFQDAKLSKRQLSSLLLLLLLTVFNRLFNFCINACRVALNWLLLHLRLRRVLLISLLARLLHVRLLARLLHVGLLAWLLLHVLLLVHHLLLCLGVLRILSHLLLHLHHLLLLLSVILNWISVGNLTWAERPLILFFGHLDLFFNFNRI